MWNDERMVRDCGIDVPAWIDQDITWYDIAAIAEGGCASGAYMPAVTYSVAMDTMREYGDEVFEYLTDVFGAIPQVKDESFSGYCCAVLSSAVELWAFAIHSDYEEQE